MHTIKSETSNLLPLSFDYCRYGERGKAEGENRGIVFPLVYLPASVNLYITPFPECMYHSTSIAVALQKSLYRDRHM